MAAAATTATPAMAVYPSAPPSSVAQDSIITTSVTVTVTIGAVKKHLVSYWFLWFLYLLATLLCAHQVFRDKRSVVHKSQRDVESHNATNTNGPHESSSGDTTRKMFYRLLLFALLSRLLLMPLAVYSGAPWLQFVACTFPMMAFASAWALIVSFFVQLVGTATGVSANYTSPSIVMQSIAYTLYVILILTSYLWNRNASVLVFALLCCVYAALFGVLVLFGPKLLSLLRTTRILMMRRGRRRGGGGSGSSVSSATTPSANSLHHSNNNNNNNNNNNSNSNNGGGRVVMVGSGLAIRLVVCCALCTLVFAARTIGLTLMVVAPPKTIQWWWSYGTLELLPAVALLVMMQPLPSKPHNGGGSNKNSPNSVTRQTYPPQTHHHHNNSNSNIRRSQPESISLLQSRNSIGGMSASSTQGSRSITREQTPLLKPAPTYGGTTATSAAQP